MMLNRMKYEVKMISTDSPEKFEQMVADLLTKDWLAQYETYRIINGTISMLFTKVVLKKGEDERERRL